MKGQQRDLLFLAVLANAKINVRRYSIMRMESLGASNFLVPGTGLGNLNFRLCGEQDCRPRLDAGSSHVSFSWYSPLFSPFGISKDRRRTARAGVSREFY